MSSLNSVSLAGATQIGRELAPPSARRVSVQVSLTTRYRFQSQAPARRLAVERRRKRQRSGATHYAGRWLETIVISRYESPQALDATFCEVYGLEQSLYR